MRYSKRKAKLFHAGRGLWEVRYKDEDNGLHGVGYFYPKKEAKNIIKKVNLRLSSERKTKPFGLKVRR